MTVVKSEQQANLAIITIDNPPVNATSVAVRSGLLDAVRQVEASGITHGIIRCSGKTFVAGGDVAEFGKSPQLPHLPDVYLAIEQSGVIWAAALHGTVLGGGFELAMACDLRVAEANTRFGLPEVSLGLIPGAGGTQRLPRLVGVELAIDLATSGRMIDAATLLAAGGLDAIDTSAEESSLFAYTREQLALLTTKPLAVSQRQVPVFKQSIFAESRKKIIARAKGANAPELNLDAIQWATELAFKQGQTRERQLHLSLRDSAQSLALRHAFFAQRKVAKPAMIKGAQANSFNHIVVVGGGLMGAGIAATCLLADLQVVLIEQDQDACDTAHERVLDILNGAVKRGKINSAKLAIHCSRFEVSLDYAAASNADLAIEAVFEDLKTKQHVFSRLAAHMRSDAILSTNTSYLDPREIATGIDNPQRIVGLHFFSPAHVMKLLEIVRTPQTSATTLATAFALAKRLNKVGVLSGICDGFIGNRLLMTYRRQADYLLADGALPAQIDQAMRSFGMPMGPYELQDLTGLQISWANRKRQASSRNPRERYVAIADTLCELERFGQRSGKGWYRYQSASRAPIVDEQVTEIIIHYAASANIKRQVFNDDDIREQLLAVLANEGARVVEEGIAERELDVDMVKLHGYGFPGWRGGPMYTAGILGDKLIRERLHQVSTQSPHSWTIARRYQS